MGFAFVIISCLDKIADATCCTDEKAEEMVDSSVGKIIVALSILVGFAWEHSFHRGVEVIVEKMPTPPWLQNPVLLQMVGTLAISSLVVFSWRKYILAKVLTLEERRKHQHTPVAKSAANGDTGFSHVVPR